MNNSSSSKKLTYKRSGVDYERLDAFKVAAQTEAAATALRLQAFGYREVTDSRGESAFVWDEGDKYNAMVNEGLGTKSLVADEVRKITGRTHYDTIAQDTVAMIVNDIITVGAMPKVVMAHFSVGDATWFADTERSADLARGFRQACELAGATWGGGETPALKGVLEPAAIELSGSAVGEITPKKNLVIGDKLSPGNTILLLKSTGIHANGVSMAREIAKKLPEGYATRLDSGITYGEALLQPTPVYVNAVKALLEADIDIRYMANITGHGWRKLMRAPHDLGYIVEEVPEPPEIFEFMQTRAGASDEEFYGNHNMGAGYAIFIQAKHTTRALRALSQAKYPAIVAGAVAKGSKRLEIRPKKLVYKGDSLRLRATSVGRSHEILMLE